MYITKTVYRNRNVGVSLYNPLINGRLSLAHVATNLDLKSVAMLLADCASPSVILSYVVSEPSDFYDFIEIEEEWE